jgi:hypothetical protein
MLQVLIRAVRAVDTWIAQGLVWDMKEALVSLTSNATDAEEAAPKAKAASITPDCVVAELERHVLLDGFRICARPS